MVERASSLILLSAALALASPLAAAPAPGPQDPIPDEVEAALRALKAIMEIPVVTVTRSLQHAGEAPATVVVITREQIRRRGYRSLLDVFRDLPDFKVDYRGHWDYLHDVTVRGVAGHDRLLLLLDGTRISGPTNEPLPILENYPVHLLQQIEVVYGPASALYGADAVSGVVNLISRVPEGGQATVQMGDSRQRFSNVIWGGSTPGGLQVTVAGQWFFDGQPDLAGRWADYRGFAGQRENRFPTIYGPMTAPVPFSPEPSTPNRAGAVYAALNWESLSIFAFHNQASFSSSTVDTPDNAIYSEDVFLAHRLTVLGGRFNVKEGDWTGETSLSASDYELEPGSSYANVFTEFRKGYQYAASQAFKGEQQVRWSPRQGFSITGGATYEVFHATPWSTNTVDPVDPSRQVEGKMLGVPLDAKFYFLRYHNTSAYLQVQWAPTDVLQLTAGARNDHNSRFGSSVNPRFGAVWKVGGGHLKALFGTAFLAPSPYTAYKYFGTFHPAIVDGNPTYESDFMQLPNPGLKPVKSRTAELSFQRRLGTHVVVHASLYQTRQTDIYADVSDLSSSTIYNGSFLGYPVKTIFVNTNLGRSRIHGGSLRLDFTQALAEGSLTAWVAYSGVDGRVDPLGDGQEYELDHVSPSMLKAAADVQWGAWSIQARVERLGAQRLTAFRPGTRQRATLDGYTDLRIHVRWQVSRRLEALLTLSNALDAHYRQINANADPAGNQSFLGAPQDPRRIIGGLSYRF